ncbi:MAG: hypothetical protein ACOYON_08545 [Fimbriimonas sp.]
MDLVRNNMRIAIIAAALVVASVASAQFIPSVTKGEVMAENAVLVTASGKTVTVKLGDKIEFPNGLTITVQKHTRLPIGAKVKVNGEDVTLPFSGPRTELAQYWAAFSIAGPTQQSDGLLKGGTKTVWGPLLTLGTTFDKRAKYLAPRNLALPLSIGGWYFRPDKRGNDVYQIHLRQFVTRSFGVQVAYLNSTTTSAPTATYHGFFQVSSTDYDPNAKTPWSVEIGVGLLNDFTPNISLATGDQTPQHSLNLSTYAQVGVGVGGNISLTGSFWFFRDRNVDVNRLGVGVQIRF